MLAYLYLLRHDASNNVMCSHSSSQGMRVAVKKLELQKVELTTSLLVELRDMRDVNHENLIRFIGRDGALTCA